MKKILIVILLLICSIQIQIHSQYAHLFGSSADVQFQLTDLGTKLLAHFDDARNQDNLTLVGSKVSQWNETVEGYHFTQSTDANRPTWESGEGIHLNATVNSETMLSSFVRSNSDFTCFIVFKNNSYVNQARIINREGYFQMQQVASTGVNYIAIYTIDGSSVYGNALNDNNYHTLCYEKKSTSISQIWDGNKFTPDFANTQSLSINNNLYLANRSSLDRGGNITVREIILTTGTLTTKEKANVINYLNKKHGLTSRFYPVGHRYNDYILSSNTVVPDTENSNNQANTGLCLDESLGEIYVVETPRNYIKVYDTNFTFLREFTATGISQGLAKDVANNQFYSWSGTRLYKFSSTGAPISDQAFDPYSGTYVAGHIALDNSETQPVIWVSSSGAPSIKKWVYNPNTGLFEYSASLTIIGGAGEGIAYDARTNTLWIHQFSTAPYPPLLSNSLTNIDKNGKILNVYLVHNVGEGIAVNTSRGTILENFPGWYHDNITNGNICTEKYVEYLR